MTPTPPTTAESIAVAFSDHIVGFVQTLRSHGVPVGPGETVDAANVLGVVDLGDRDAVKEGLACTLIRRTSHRPTFDRLFDLWFPHALGQRSSEESDSARDSGDLADGQVPRRGDGEVDFPALRELIARQLAEGDRPEPIAANLVAQLGEYESRNGPSFSAYQTLKELRLDELIGKISAGLATRTGAEHPTDLINEISDTTARRRIAELRKEIEDDVRSRTAQKLGRERVAEYAVPKQLEDVNFLAANRDELTALRRTVQVLSRRLASRIANRRKKYRRGEIDLRKTLRAAMSTGGVPIRLVQRKPRITRPELVVLCDISGSVAGFSQFTMLLVHSLREQFSKIRIFAFIDATDEVTQYFTPETELTEVLPQIIRKSKVIDMISNSDYGKALETFVTDYPDAVTSRTSLLILGDGRTNYRDPKLGRLKQLVTTARHAHWLNPESQMFWASGDSAANQYREIIDMHECRSARQLTSLLDKIIPVH